MLKISICSLIFVLLLSCEKKTKDILYFREFKKEYNLKHQIKLFQPHYRGQSALVYFIDNKLFVFNPLSADSIISVYNTETLRKVGSIGFVGEQPGHVLRPGGLTFSANNKKLFLVDNAKGHIASFDIDSALNTSNYLPSTFITYPSGIFVSFISHLAEDIFITRQLDVNDDLILKFQSNDIIDTIGKWYKTDDPIVLMDEFTQYYYVPTKHPSKELYASSYNHYDVIQITDSLGNSKFTIGPERISYKDLKNEYVAYSWIFPSNDLIYAAYKGEDFSPKQFTAFSDIHVFNWEGKPIAKFKLDIPVLHFTIDSKSSIIYALADNENGDFVIFELPEL